MAPRKHNISPLHTKLVSLIEESQTLSGKREFKSLIKSLQDVYYIKAGGRGQGRVDKNSIEALEAHQVKCVDYILNELMFCWVKDNDTKSPSPYVFAITKFVTGFIIETTNEAEALELKYKLNELGTIEPILIHTLRFIKNKFDNESRDPESTRVKIRYLKLLKELIDRFHEHNAFVNDSELGLGIIELLQYNTETDRSIPVKELSVLILGNFVLSDRNLSKWILSIIDCDYHPSVTRACVRAFNKSPKISSSTYMRLLHKKELETEALIGLAKCGIQRLKKNELLMDILDWGLTLGNENRKKLLVKYLLKPWFDQANGNLINLLSNLALELSPSKVYRILNALFPGNSRETWNKVSSCILEVLNLTNNLVIESESYVSSMVKYQLWFFLCHKFHKQGPSITSKLVPQPLEYVAYIKEATEKIFIMQDRDTGPDSDEYEENAKCGCLAYAIKIGEFVFWEESNRREMAKVLKSIFLNKNLLDPLVLVSAVDLAQKVMDEIELRQICYQVLRYCEESASDQSKNHVQVVGSPEANSDSDEFFTPPESPGEDSVSQESFGSPDPSRRIVKVQARLEELENIRANTTLLRNKLISQLDRSNGNGTSHPNFTDKMEQYRVKEASLDAEIQKLKELDPNAIFDINISSFPILDNDELTTVLSQNFEENSVNFKIKAPIILNRCLKYWTQPLSSEITSFIDNFGFKYLEEDSPELRLYAIRILLYQGVYDKTTALKNFCIFCNAINYDPAPIMVNVAFKCLVDICLRFDFKYLFGQYEPDAERVYYGGYPSDLKTQSLDQLKAAVDRILLDMFNRHGVEDPKFNGTWVKGIIKLFFAKKITTSETLDCLLRIWIDPVEQIYPSVADIDKFIPWFAESSIGNAELVCDAMLKCISHIAVSFEKAESFGDANTEKLIQFITSCTARENLHDELASKVCSLISSDFLAFQNIELLTVLKFCTIRGGEIVKKIIDTLKRLEEEALPDAEPSFARIIKKRSKEIQQKLKKVSKNVELGNDEIEIGSDELPLEELENLDIAPDPDEIETQAPMDVDEPLLQEPESDILDDSPSVSVPAESPGADDEWDEHPLHACSSPRKRRKLRK